MISIGVAGLVLLILLAIQRKWQATDFKDIAYSAGDFVLETTGIRGRLPILKGYEVVKINRVGRYRAVLYRASPAPLAFTQGRFIIYDLESKPLVVLQTLEGSQRPWSALYDFAGKHGLPAPGKRGRPVYSRILAAGKPDIIIGQYSGGEHCCTTATIVELADDQVKTIGQIERIDGMPFDGLELRKVPGGGGWQFIAHRPYRTVCGSHQDAADVPVIYAYQDGAFTDQTHQQESSVAAILRQNLGKWRQTGGQSLETLQTIAADFALLGQRDQAKRFFAMNLAQFLPQLQENGIDPNSCLEDVGMLVDRLTIVD